MDFKSQLDEILEKYKPANYGFVIKSKPLLYQWLISQVKIKTNSISELVFLYKNPDFNPICNLGNKRKFKDGKYFLGCGKQCACVINYNSQTQKRIHQTRSMDDKQRVFEKTKATLLEKYQTDCVFKSDIIKKKIKDNNIEKYGFETPSKNNEVKRKIKESIFKRSKEYKGQIKDRWINTMKQKYGVLYPLQSPILKEKAKLSFLEKYGVDHNWKADSVRNKIKKTNIARYNVIYPAQRHISADHLNMLDDADIFKKIIENKTYAKITKSIPVDRTTILNYSHKHHCKNLIKFNSNSYLEDQISEFCQNHNIFYIKNDRSAIGPLELDFYFPKEGFAIECHGLYWHSENSGSKSHTYHYDKWKLCKDKGLDLYQYFEDEINNNIDIIKSKILYLNKLHQGKSIGARSLVFDYLVSLKDENQFYKINHIQGYRPDRSITLGAWDNQRNLVACMSLKQLNESLIEIVRFATDILNIYPGSFTKMLNWYIRENNFKGNIISWSDNRHSNGNLYRFNGFSFLKTQPPSYFITDYECRWRREHFMKNKIKQRYPHVDLSKTQRQLEQALGFDRIWDAGKQLWRKSV